MAASNLPVPKFASGRSATAAADTAVVVTLAAVTGAAHVLKSIVWSYNGDPTGGAITVEDGSGTTVERFDITVGGPGAINFGEGVKGSPGTALIVTLAAGGASVVGKLNVHASLS